MDDKKTITIEGGNPDQIANLRHRIDCWNRIKYPDDKELRITFVTLKPSDGYTWKQETDDMIEEYNQGTVTTAPKDKE